MEAYRERIVQRIIRNLLDIQLLRLIHKEPTWGYLIAKQAEAKLGIKLRHGALYPLLKGMEREGFIVSKRQRYRGRTRKIYSITREGEKYIGTYNDVLREQLTQQDLK